MLHKFDLASYFYIDLRKKTWLKLSNGIHEDMNMIVSIYNNADDIKIFWGRLSVEGGVRFLETVEESDITGEQLWYPSIILNEVLYVKHNTYIRFADSSILF